MTASGRESAAAARSGNVPVQVWDWPVRAFHWATVALVLVSTATAYIRGNAMEWHTRSGYAILALVLFRVAWGVVGGRHARFGSFLTGPAAVIAYVRSVGRRAKPTYAGHNPLGGWSVVALLLVLLLQAGTGMFSRDDIATEGPLVRLISDELSDEITWFHLRGIWVLGTLVALHVAAVFYYQFTLKEDLLRPMLDGVKCLPAPLADAGNGRARGGRALLLLALCAFAVWWIVSKP